MADYPQEKAQLPCPANLLIPHASPMLLIDALLSREGDRATASAFLSHESMFKGSQRGILPEYFIEIIAQTMAAANGFDAIQNLSPVKNGFITEVSTFEIHTTSTEKTAFEIRVEEIMAFGSMKLMKGEVFADDTVLASGEIKIYQDDQDADTMVT